MSLADAIADVQAKALTLPGVKAAPDNPPEAINQLPFSICYVRTLAQMELQSAGFATGLFTLIWELHFARHSLPRAVELATPYAELFLAKIIADPKLGNTVSTVTSIRGKFGRLGWGGKEDQFIGWQFEIDVKLRLT